MPSIHIDVGLTLSQFLGSLPTFITVVLAWLYANKRVDDLGKRMDDLKSGLKESIQSEAALIRAEMRRVEEVMDARLKHLEDEN